MANDDAKGSKTPSPFEGLDYPSSRQLRRRAPSTGDLGKLGRDLQAMFGVAPQAAFAAAVLTDQGRVQEALELLSAVEVEEAS